MNVDTLPPETSRRIRAVHRRVQRIVRENNHLPFAMILALVAAEIRKFAPELGHALAPSLLRAWIRSARRLARSADLVRAPAPPPPPLLPSATLAAEAPILRWPAIESGVKDLLARQVLTWPDFDRLTNEAKNTAFSVARVVTEGGIESIRAAVARGLAEGTTLRQFAGEIADAGLPPGQVETVFRTQVGQAQAAGMRAVLDHPAVAAEFPYLAYHAVHDSRTGDKVLGLPCPTHLMMEQLGIQGTNIYRADDPVIIKFTPPWRWNCRCHVSPVSLEDAAAAGIREAQKWLRSGIPPISPAWVKHPPFDLPKGWPFGGGGIRPISP